MLLDHDGKSNRHAGVLPEHRLAGLTRLQQAEDYAAHISRISREYVPLSRAVLPDRVEHTLSNGLCQGHPPLEEYEVYKILSERKLTGAWKAILIPELLNSAWRSLFILWHVSIGRLSHPTNGPLYGNAKNK